MQIALDRTAVVNNITLQVRYPLSDVPTGEHINLATKVSEHCGSLDREISVLLLGTVRQFKTEKTEKAIGIIVMEVPDPQIGKWWKRLGVCLWNSFFIDKSSVPMDVESALHVTDAMSKDWYRERGIFG